MMCDRNVPTRSKDKVINNNKIQHFYIVPYSRTPLIRPPSESHWCGPIRGMVIREGFDNFPEHTYRVYIRQCITVASTLKMAFGVYRYPLHTAEKAATKPLQCFQARPHARRLTQNGVGLRWPRFQNPGFRKHHSNIDIHTSLAVVTFVLFPIYSLPFATS